MNKEVLAALNKQLEKEFDASASYLGMTIYFEKQLFKGFAAWFNKQVGEEKAHAMKIVQYILDRGGDPIIPGTRAPKTDYQSVLHAMKAAAAHEKANTAGIHECLETANKANDPATMAMLQWFVNEQVEEEKWADEYAQMVDKIGSSVGGLWMFDHRVGKKVE